MEISEHIAAVGREAQLFATAARRAGLDTDVETCPGWSVRDLVRHLSEIHLWAAGIVAGRRSKIWPEGLSTHVETWPDLAVFWPEDDDLVDWYLETNANLVRCLEAASPADDIPTFLPAPSPLAMWARRQAHEIAIHRFDAQNAAGGASTFTPAFDPVFATDGIDETLDAFLSVISEVSPPNDWTIAFHTQDTEDHWHLTFSPDGVTTIRDDAPAQVKLTGNASDLYLVVWNRARDETITVDGDPDILDTWHRKVRRRWTFTTDYS